MRPFCTGKYEVERLKRMCKAMKKAGLITSYSIRGVVSESGNRYGTMHLDYPETGFQAIMDYWGSFEPVGA